MPAGQAADDPCCPNLVSPGVAWQRGVAPRAPDRSARSDFSRSPCYGHLPECVFTLNAKHHPGAKVWVGGDTLMVNGKRQPYVRNSRHEAARASRLLTAACGFPVVVTGVVVLVRADDISIKTRPDGVCVLARFQLAKWRRNQGTTLDEVLVTSVDEAARRSTTWQRPS
jgi:hypothetical protein